MDRDKLRIGVLGAGRIGRIHGGNVALHPRARLAAVADASREAARSLAEATGAEIAEVDAVIEAADIDALVICTPTDTHADLVERGARAGKAIFCEKPVSLDAERTRACLRVVEETGTALMIGFNRRFDPSFADAPPPHRATGRSARSSSSRFCRATPRRHRRTTWHGRAGCSAT